MTENEKIAGGLLSKATGARLTPDDYETWLEGDGDGSYDKFDRAAKKYLGRAYPALAEAARMDSGLCALLEGKPDSFQMGGLILKPFRQLQKGSTSC